MVSAEPGGGTFSVDSSKIPLGPRLWVILRHRSPGSQSSLSLLPVSSCLHLCACLPCCVQLTWCSRTSACAAVLSPWNSSSVIHRNAGFTSVSLIEFQEPLVLVSTVNSASHIIEALVGYLWKMQAEGEKQKGKEQEPGGNSVWSQDSPGLLSAFPFPIALQLRLSASILS